MYDIDEEYKKHFGKASETLDKQAEKMARGQHYWIWAIVEGRLYVYGRKFNTYQEAQSAASRINVRGKQLEGYEIEELPTVDISSATRMIKAKRLETTGDLLGATSRARHSFN